MRRLLAYAAGFASLSFTALAAATETQIALDLDFAHPVAQPRVDSGGGFAVRLGQQLDLVAVTVTGEFGLSYESFGGSRSPTLYNAFTGGRLRFGKILEPGTFLHVGASHLADVFDKSWAPMIDLGLSLDFTLLPLVDIGVHGTYVHRFATDSTGTFAYLLVGPHAALVF